MSCTIQDTEPSTSTVQRNVYHLNMPLFVLDIVRQLQNHPQYCCGLKECDIIEMVAKSPYATGDVNAQVMLALKNLTNVGYLRHTPNGYQTLGPFAKLAMARTPRQFDIAWDRLAEVQKFSSTSLSSSSSSRNNTC